MGPLDPVPLRRRARWPRPMLALRRRPRLQRAVALAVGLAVAAAVHQVLASSAGERERWGTTTEVAVATTDLAAGHVLGTAEVELRALPLAAVPAGALAQLPAGEVLRHPVRAGEVLVEDRVAPSGLRGLAAHLPPGTRAVAVPVDEATAPPLAAGDRVDVLVAVDPTSVVGPPAFTVARSALVLAVGERSVTLAIGEASAARVAFASAAGVVALALVGA